LNGWLVIAPAAKTAVAAILLPAGVAKLGDRQGFVDVVRGFAILPDAAVPAFATGLPVAELLVGVALLSGVLFDWSLAAWAGLAAMCLFATFGIAIATNLVRGRTDISCGCFGRNSRRRLTWGLVGRVLCCLAICALTLPVVHQGATPSGDLKDRASAALIGAAAVAMIWLGRFVITAGSAGFSQSS
jgi:hypothetical protein